MKTVTPNYQAEVDKYERLRAAAVDRGDAPSARAYASEKIRFTNMKEAAEADDLTVLVMMQVASVEANRARKPEDRQRHQGRVWCFRQEAKNRSLWGDEGLTAKGRALNHNDDPRVRAANQRH